MATQKLGMMAQSLPDNLKDRISFTSEITYGQLRFEEKKNMPFFMLKLAHIPGVILTRYYIVLDFSDKKYDEMIYAAKAEMGKQMIDSMFPEIIKQQYEERVKEINQEREIAKKNNPPMAFFTEFWKYETKEYTERDNEYWMTFKIDPKIAMMMIEKKSSFDSYKATFYCPGGENQKETTISLSYADKTPGQQPDSQPASS